MNATLSNVDGLRTVSRPGVTDETELWKLRNEDPRAREELALRYQQFARRLALRYNKGHGPTDDLIQVAMVGLMNAIDRFDPDEGAGFAAFASPTIIGEIKRYFRDKVWLVRLPRSIQEEIHAVDEATSELAAELRRTPTATEIEARANIDAGGVDRAELGRSNRQMQSLDTGPGPDGIDPSERVGEIEPGFSEFDETEEVRSAMNKLSESEQLVLRLRFDEDMTQQEIAERVGCSQMHVSRLIRRSLDSITEHLGENGTS